MRKVFVNGNLSLVRVLSPFAYKDPIKTLDKSNEARVTLDGVRVFRSAVTSGRDVKNVNGGLKFHLYFYSSKDAAEARDTSRREFFPITSEEFRAYKDDPAYTIELVSATGLEKAETEVLPDGVNEAVRSEEAIFVTVSETEVLPDDEPANEGTTRKSRRK